MSVDVVEEVLGATVTELERNQHKLAHPGPKDDVDVIAVNFYKFILNAMKIRYNLLFYYRKRWIVT